MKVLFISKYPPTEGGVSSSNYRLAKGLGERGVEVFIATNAFQTEAAYRENIDLNNAELLAKLQPKNVFLYSLEKNPPKHIPYSQAYLSRLVNLGLKIIGERGADLIYAHYLEPYAAAGFILKKITGLPLVIKHAGSDIERILPGDDFKYFLGRVLMGADALLTNKKWYYLWRSFGVSSKKLINFGTMINDREFSPDGNRFEFSKFNLEASTSKNIPILTYIGKTGENKGIAEMFEALEGIEEDFRLVFLSNEASDKTKSLIGGLRIGRNLQRKFLRVGFLPPWEIPSVLRVSSALLCLENNFSIKNRRQVLPREAISCAAPVIFSREIFDKFKAGFPKTAPNFNVVENVQNTAILKEKLRGIILNPKKAEEDAKIIRNEFLEHNDWDGFLDAHIKLFKSIIRKRRFFL